VTLKGTRVLVVEDEALVCIMIKRALTRLGCEVVATAALLDDAILKASTMALDAATLDINLAGSTSYPVARALRQRKVPFLFATGYEDTELPADLQGVLVLSKPFKIRSLEHALHEVMGEARFGST
jgi:CheY-like chemotaxis protein